MEFIIEKALEILKQTPKTLSCLLENLSDDWVLSNEGIDTWSPYDIVGHLIHGEKTDWIPRLNIILYEDNKRFTPFDRFAQFESSQGKNIKELLSEFKHLRSSNIDYLQSLNLPNEQLNLTGIHPEFGDVTIRELLSTWVTHDLGHIAQISRVMAKQYKEEVGPWTAYVSILNK
ncbi:DinB family protein [Tenacibaculum adriaticum]|uniref:DinB family protein n=1 Tax=Tenacibaculum adriaticum TaxID=413713 RepID=A0A5S5DUE4_9FLAO|nr:DinB family protein [Tenacibaculum adriaticum]TYP99580.1 DinB family protein [Tenacibaculum adriaticum]